MEDADLSPSVPQRHGKQTCPSHLALLPPEIIENVLSSLDNSSIKSLRLTCRRFGAIAALRINRVFLSANPLNIQVFRAIADHDVLRHRIVEIVYDDARLWRNGAEAPEARHPGAPNYCCYYLEDGPDMEWFENDDPKRPEYAALVRRVHAGLSPEESWEYYDGLLRQQEEIMASGADADALRYGLQRFPALRKVTVTPATHGWLFTPLYETPMIRAFPYGFNCPIPRAWPYAVDDHRPLQVAPWEDEKTRWRGFNLVTKILAEGRHNVVEYEIDGHHLGTGLNCRIFDDRCNEYDAFVLVLCLPGFKKLQLSLFVDGQQRLGWPALRNGLLRNALAEATQLEHVSIATGRFDHAWEYEPPGLGRFLPIECWPKLQHFELWHVDVHLADLLSVVSQLPDGLLSLQLNSLHMCSGCYRELLDQMRDRLHWCEQRPQARVMIGVHFISGIHDIPGRTIWLEKEIDDFFKRGGINPFELEDIRYLHLPRFGMGVVRDAFDMDYVRP
ncbi:hypothetical protein TRIATDRAFT_40425 [Trichoderma atroviride IMI 206040]|uniref:F-box domain-containing protein n=1 Tax=Hypocrea atroviridis (strain ATCC 20476 / IMI 206040) TaxID=452589 RepID=G9NUA0_HYPAI|nr:uncharacterized protein TRIATDRAFT_40425 [Trichoderma atroviride IMI 206040]EHK45633.1 hypothetical protein TRIATDRAFT_40425 [Trichoderma atroviride IMI 206040]